MDDLRADVESLKKIVSPLMDRWAVLEGRSVAMLGFVQLMLVDQARREDDPLAYIMRVTELQRAALLRDTSPPRGDFDHRPHMEEMIDTIQRGALQAVAPKAQQ